MVTPGSAPADIYWEVYDQLGNFVAGGFAPEDITLCIPDGCFTMYLWDFAGDGWNGATYTITNVATNAVEATGTMANGSYAARQVILGAGCGPCSPYTMNVSSGSAPVDVSWELYDPSFMLVAAGGAPSSVPLCLPPECYTLYMYDAFGNGWNGATYSFVNGSNTVISSGTMVTGGFATSLISIGGGCSTGTCSTYTMSVTGGTAPADITWNFMSMGVNYASGGAPSTVQMCLDTGCYIMQMFDAVGNGWNGATWTLKNALNVTVASGTLTTGTTGNVAVPLGITGPCTVPTTITASDCPQAVNVCTNLNFTIDPNGWGSIWEIPALGSTSNPEYYWGDGMMSPWGTDHYGCLMGQEINTTWMVVNIAVGGSLEFTLGANGSQSGFYDWTMFPYTSSTCSSILANTIAPIRCNWNYASYGGTGLAATVPAGGVPENYETPLNVLAGQRYIICFSNWSSVSTVVPLVFGGTAVVSCNPIILPVELIELYAVPGQMSIDVKWTTATEHNTSHFIVERSADGLYWHELGRTAAAGNSIDQRHYALTDASPFAGDSYYRLVSVDNDGSAHTSYVVSAHWIPPLLKCWPNPTSGEVNVELGEHARSASIVIMDELGRAVDFDRIGVHGTALRIRLQRPMGGVFTVVASDADWSRTGRLLVAAE